MEQPAAESVPSPAIPSHAAGAQAPEEAGIAIAGSARPGRLVFGALRNPNYRLLWTGFFLSNIGTWVQNVAQGWLVLQLTDSAFWLGAVGFASGVPMLLFSLLGGVYADRTDRRRLLVVTQSSLLIFALALALLTEFHVVTVAHILTLAFLVGLASAFTTPAYQAMVFDLVGPEELMNAIALNSTQFNLSRAIGPMIGGVAMGLVGAAGCFYLNAVSYLAALVGLVRIKFPAGMKAADSTSIWGNLAEGFRYVLGEKPLRLMLSMGALMGTLGMPFITLLPIFARDIFHRGAAGLGLLTSATGIGAVIGALGLAAQGDFGKKGRIALLANFVFAAALIVLSLANTFSLALVATALIGSSMVSFTATTNTLIQKLVPPAMRGRVMSMYVLAVMGSLPIGNLLAGSVAEHAGAPAALTIGGGLIALFAGYVLVFHPETRALE